MDIEETYAVSCFYELLLTQLRAQSQASIMGEDFHGTLFGLAEKLLLRRKLISDEIIVNFFSLFIAYCVINQKVTPCLKAGLLFLKSMTIVI